MHQCRLNYNMMTAASLGSAVIHVICCCFVVFSFSLAAAILSLGSAKRKPVSLTLSSQNNKIYQSRCHVSSIFKASLLSQSPSNLNLNRCLVRSRCSANVCGMQLNGGGVFVIETGLSAGDYQVWVIRIDVHHPPESIQKFLPQELREHDSPQRVYSSSWGFSTEEGPVEPRPLQPGLIFHLNFREVLLMRATGRERRRAKCVHQGFTWTALTLKISLVT